MRRDPRPRRCPPLLAKTHSPAGRTPTGPRVAASRFSCPSHLVALAGCGGHGVRPGVGGRLASAGLRFGKQSSGRELVEVRGVVRENSRHEDGAPRSNARDCRAAVSVTMRWVTSGKRRHEPVVAMPVAGGAAHCQCRAHRPRPGASLRNRALGPDRPPQVPRRRNPLGFGGRHRVGVECRRMGHSPAPAAPAVPRHAGALAHPREDPPRSQDHGGNPTAGLRGRKAPLPVAAWSVRDRQPLSTRPAPAGKTSRRAVCLRALGSGPRREQDGVSASWAVVRHPWLCLPDCRHAATGRDPRHSPRHLSVQPVVVALGGVHPGRGRVLERGAGPRLPAVAARG